MELLNEFYAGCRTMEEFNEARRRLNLWILCDLDPVAATRYLEGQRAAGGRI